MLNFIKVISAIDENWEMKHLIQIKINEIEKQVSDSHVIAAVSGGVGK